MLTITRKIELTMLLMLFSNTYANDSYYASLDDINLSDLGKMKVYTSNRYVKDIDSSSSVVTVISAEDISRRGYKTLDEALSKVVGFHSSNTLNRAVVSSRGFVQDTNVNYLLLMDGHKLNEQTYGGMDERQIFPLMSNIKRIEVVRGPGATLWGTDALNGIINIITKSAADIDTQIDGKGTFYADVDYEFEQKRNITNMGYAKAFDEGEIVASLMHFESNVGSGANYILNPSAGEVQQHFRDVIQYNYKPSYNFYTKGSYKDFELKLSKVNNKHNTADFSNFIKEREVIGQYDMEWAELSYNPQLTEHFSLQSRVYYDNNSVKYDKYERNDELMQIQKNTDEGYGIEAILHHNTDENDLLAGIYYERRDLAIDFIKGFPLSSKPENRILTERYYAQDIVNKTKAVFIEDSYKGLDDWQFTLGARYEDSSPLGDTYSFLPRAAIFHQLSESWYGKYSYNTGTVEPTHFQQRDTINVNPLYPIPRYTMGADKSQTNQSHDFQIGYRDQELEIKTTFYYTKLDDLILDADSFGPFSIDGYDNVYLGQVNLNDLVQKGVELELKYQIFEPLRLYGNYAYSHAKYQKREMYIDGIYIADTAEDFSIADNDMMATGVPEHSWNLGFDWDIQPDISLNVHYKGWSHIISKTYDVVDASSRTYQVNYKKSGAEHFVDLNLRWQPFSKTETEFSVYIKNIGDNTGPFPTQNTEIEPQTGRQAGIKFGFKF